MNPAQAKGLVRQAWQAGFPPSAAWHGFHPLRSGTWGDVAGPWRDAMPDLRRDAWILIAGEFAGATWVAVTGEMVATFATDWLGIPATGGEVRFRFGEFCRVEGGAVAEIRCLVDLVALLRQAGIRALTPSYGRDGAAAGPATGDGLGPHDPAESAATLALVEEMIFGGLNRYDGRDQDSQGLERFWHPDMAWHGPAGIGSACGLAEFKANAQGPIVRAFPDRRGVGHVARIAEGCYAASTGWPSLVGTHTGEFHGWAPTGESAGWNIMDFWRRDGDLLRENWVLIDLVDAARQAGVDLLGVT